MRTLNNTRRTSVIGTSILCGLSLAASSILGNSIHFVKAAFAADGAPAAEEEYDRLDGMGASGKKVNVIEWEGNLEVHVYPAGSLKSLALTIDHKTKDKPVMVIGYRFIDNPQKQLIRRAIIDGISLNDNFRTYRDPSADGYDKIVITNNNLDKVLTAFKLEPKPTQLYPDGHPALVAQQDAAADNAPRKPAAVSDVKTDNAKAEQAKQDQEEMEDSGTIHPFLFDGPRGGPRSR